MELTAGAARSFLLESLEIGQDVIFELAMVPVLKVLTMGALGALLARPSFDVINPASTKLLSKLVFALFLPCLIFTELGAQVTFGNMMHWWFIPVNVILATVIGCGVGYLVVLVCRPPRQFYRFTVVMTGIGNTGNLPLAIISSICHSSTTPFGSSCKRTGVAYVSLSTWISVIIVYVFAYHMLEPPDFDAAELESTESRSEHVEGDTESNDNEVEEEHQRDGEGEEKEGGRDVNDELHHSFLEADWPGLSDAHNEDEHRVPFLKSIWRPLSTSSLFSVTSEEDETRRVTCLKEPRVMKQMRMVGERTPLQHIFQPPTVASLLAILVGLFPRSKSVLFGYKAPLGFVDDSLEILANAVVPCIMLVLGGTLSGGPGKSELGRRTMIGICVARLFVMPALGVGVVTSAGLLGFLPEGDSMFKFVLFLHYAMPTAILCGAMASLRGYGEKEAASLLFWQHLLAVVSVSLAIAVYINILAYNG